MQELCTATDLALRATKVTARALGQTMSTLVVQERHLWLTLADTRETDKHRFLDSPISQAGLFGEAVEDFAQQFSAAQKHSAPAVCCSLHLATGSTLLRPPPPLQLCHSSSLYSSNHQGGLRSRHMSQLGRHLLLWSQKHLRSLCAIHIPGKLNRAADELSHQPALLGEWRLHPETVQLIGRCFGDAQVDLFASPGHVLLPVVLLPVQGDPCHGRAGIQLASASTQIRISPCEPSGTDTVQDQGGRGAGPFGGTVLAQSDLVSRTNAHRYSSFLAYSFLREGAPSGTRVQTCGISTCKL